MVFSNIPSAEQGGELFEKLFQIEDLQVGPLAKMKKNMLGKLSSGGEF